MNNEREIGAIVRALRGDLSLRAFAERCGISHTSLDNIEKGYDFRTGKPTQPKTATLAKIARAAKVPLAYIIGEETEKAPGKVPEAEDELIQLIRLMPEDMKKIYVDALRAALKAQGLIP